MLGSRLGVLLARCLLINGGVLAVMPLLLANKDNGVVRMSQCLSTGESFLSWADEKCCVRQRSNWEFVYFSNGFTRGVVVLHARQTKPVLVRRTGNIHHVSVRRVNNHPHKKKRTEEQRHRRQEHLTPPALCKNQAANNTARCEPHSHRTSPSKKKGVRGTEKKRDCEPAKPDTSRISAQRKMKTFKKKH